MPEDSDNMPPGSRRVSEEEMQALLAAHGPDPAPHYPQFVQTPEDRTRWDLCVSRACELTGAEPESADVQAAARALYRSEIPTGP